jgi:hypothetical protein
LGCSTQPVRHVLHAFQREGVGGLTAQSTAPHRVQAIWSQEHAQEVRELLHRSPRLFGKPRSPWTLQLRADVCLERGMTSRKGSAEAIRRSLKRLDIHWKRAKHWRTSPDPHDARKKAARDRRIRLAASHPEWVLGFEAEVWWRRVAQPARHAWTDGPPMQGQRLTSDPRDPDPDAIAC